MLRASYRAMFILVNVSLSDGCVAFLKNQAAEIGLDFHVYEVSVFIC